jgi:ubiquinone/menaquinone biosynthesis C-methylase UbiE
MDELAVPPFFMELFEQLPRQGPGLGACTRRALEMVLPLPEAPRVADIGCGSGMQTLELARALGPQARIVAIDFHEPFLAKLRSDAERAGLANRISATVGDMQQLELDDGAFDLLWSEGAIFLMGFAEGLRAWRRHLRPEGRVAVTEATWLRPDPPKPCQSFWDREYPAIGTVESNLKHIAATGYRSLGHFALPSEAWEKDFYLPLREICARYRRDGALTEEQRAVLDGVELEIDLFERYSDFYGYVFYVMQHE